MTSVSHRIRIFWHLDISKIRAEIAQLVEHTTENRRVDSSILSLGILGLMDGRHAGVVQLVERLLAKEKVTSSNLVARSGSPSGW